MSSATPPTRNIVCDKEAVLFFAEAIPSHIEVSMNYLHNTINWSITVFAGGVGAIVINEKFPNINTEILTSILLLTLAHLFIRTSKAYLNVMRFTSLDKLIIRNTSLGHPEQCFSAIDRYYLNWASPLPVHTVVVKVLFELGFFYMWVALTGIFIYAAIKTQGEYWYLIIASHVGALLEFYFGLVKSPYFTTVDPFDIAVTQR
ncbi:membrane hypothetical protein [Bradyrhizobium sp. ORS 375]|uniref:hypothetical protein n=1 Tax=Bradyrhizobium sp. (strain ORS 375) TaxID=566679 RepID=UPI0002405E3B|nr:hypothetical protein [Bradyrhizobium sp. ORS 375]CCD94417.1 membrane hypothetical protein [Bradyrhizobium sp. ORS 375]